MNLDSPVIAIPGVGETYAKALRSHGITTVWDVLRFTPSRYIDFSHPIPCSDVRLGQEVTISGHIAVVKLERTSRKRMVLVRARIEDDTGAIEAVWFNQSFLKTSLKVGRIVHLHGLVVADRSAPKVLRSPTILFDTSPRPVSIYSERSGLESGRFSRIVSSVLHLSEAIADPLPLHIQQKYQLIALSDAYRIIHRPDSITQAESAHTRLGLDELWTLMAVMRLEKSDVRQSSALPISFDPHNVKDVPPLPFALTDSQQKALLEIADDMAQKTPMRRLLNGDVGAGKTIVAFIACWHALQHSVKAVMLAPTTVLAQQHYRNWLAIFPTPNSFLFTSGAIWHGDEKINRSEALRRLTSTAAAFVCGTHAVLHQDLELTVGVGLVVVDEQHRFGVMQRAMLGTGRSAVVPHLLSLSATPIPRTAALVLYGDLEISVLPEKPVGRIPVITKLARERSRPYVYQFVDQLLARGEQAFIVCPIIGADTKNDSGQLLMLEERAAVIDEYDRLKSTIFTHRRIGLLHGRLKQAEKDAVLNQFRLGELDILVTTSVIEVGVDVPNASVMMIEGSEFFGLAQLHQLRGRVGRSTQQSYCFLFAGNWSEKVRNRLELMTTHADGFTLAEKDLALRGPGELYGTLQAGLHPFQYATLSDSNLVQTARQIADDVLVNLHQGDNGPLRQLILAKARSLHRE